MMNDRMEQSCKNLEADHDDDRVFQVVAKALGLDLVLDKILDYVIRDNNGKIMTDQAQSCRQVNKAWLKSVSRVLRISGQPLFVFDLCSENIDARGTDERAQGNKLGQFLSSITGNLHLDTHVPPYEMNTYESGPGKVFQQNAFPIFFDCLRDCGSGLVQLDLDVINGQSPCPLNNNILLPRLSSFSIALLKKDPNTETDNIGDTVNFIQSVFDASRQLKYFTLYRLFEEGENSIGAVPDCFGNLVFPPSVTDLELDHALNDRQLQSLANSSLPNLKSLKLTVNHIPITTELITTILQKFQKTLQHLRVFREADSQLPTPPTSFQLPLMEKLNELLIGTASFDLKGGHRSSLQQLVPMLTKLKLRHQTRSMFRKWTDNSCFPSVTSLQIALVSDDEIEDFDGDDSYVNIDLATMQALRSAFPSLKELQIAHVGTDMTDVRFILKEMRNLHSLLIHVHFENELESSDIWDAALLGIPQESVAALRESPDLWEGLQNQNDVSLRDLTELHTFEMSGSHPFYIRIDSSAISELTFQYAFLRMPKLTNLILQEGFGATREMAESWRMEGEGRFIFAHHYEHENGLDAEEHENGLDAEEHENGLNVEEHENWLDAD